MTQTELHNKPFEERIQKNTVMVAYWTAAWVLTTALLAFGPKFLWEENLAITLIALGINLLVGAGMIVANKNYLKSLDELYQKVYLNAMAITLGVVLIGSIPYSLLDAYEALPFKADISHLAVLMSFTFMTSLFVGMRRYR